MIYKNIKFLAPEEYLKFADKKLYPQPANKLIPEWYRKLQTNELHPTIKSCKPFLDTLCSGYILKMPYDLYIHNNFWNDKDKRYDSYQKANVSNLGYPINFPNGPSWHSQAQVKGSNILEKNNNQAFGKIHNPWLIRTPPGYSCLFVPPLNNQDDRFSIIPGIVDTDTYDYEVNFPFTINGDKYKELKTIIYAGTSIVQVIPFKRDSWSMSTEIWKKDDLLKARFNFGHFIHKLYAKLNWKIKRFK
jgi:hypothetical protein